MLFPDAARWTWSFCFFPTSCCPLCLHLCPSWSSWRSFEPRWYYHFFPTVNIFQGFCSNLFTVPRSKGIIHATLDLKDLNVCHILPPSGSLWPSRMCTCMSHLSSTSRLPQFYCGFVALMFALSYFTIALQCSQGKHILWYFYNPLLREQLPQSNQQCDVNRTDPKRSKAKKNSTGAYCTNNQQIMGTMLGSCTLTFRLPAYTSVWTFSLKPGVSVNALRVCLSVFSQFIQTTSLFSALEDATRSSFIHRSTHTTMLISNVIVSVGERKTLPTVMRKGVGGA